MCVLCVQDGYLINYDWRWEHNPPVVHQGWSYCFCHYRVILRELLLEESK